MPAHNSTPSTSPTKRMDLSAEPAITLEQLWLALGYDELYRIADLDYWQARNLDWLLKPDEEGRDAPITRQCLTQLLETPIGQSFARAWQPWDRSGNIESLGNLPIALICLWCAHGLPVSPTIEAALNPNRQLLRKTPGNWARLPHEDFEVLAVKPIDLKHFLIQLRQPLPNVVFTGPEIAQINERIDRLFLPDYPAKTPEEKAQDQLWFDCWLKRDALYIQLANIKQELNRIKSQSKIKNKILARLQKEKAQAREELAELEKAIKAIESPGTDLTPAIAKDISLSNPKTHEKERPISRIELPRNGDTCADYIERMFYDYKNTYRSAPTESELFAFAFRNNKKWNAEVKEDKDRKKRLFLMDTIGGISSRGLKRRIQGYAKYD